MKALKNISILYNSNKFRNISIIIGVGVSLFLISSFRNSSQTVSDPVLHVVQMSVNLDQDGFPEEMKEAQIDHKSTKYHNFLTAYFLQESSIERTRKKNGEQKELFAGLKNFHNVIVSRALTFF